jgi:hypothetical protein
MFGSNMETPNRMLSYNSALKKYNSIKPIRGRSDQNTRPLALRSNDNLTIRLEPTTNDILVRLYSTDIIRYSYQAAGDNDLSPIVLDPYASVLTNRVMWSILGPHVNTHWSDTNLITEVGGRYYNTPSFAVIQPAESGWTLVDGSRPVEVPYLNRKEARQALRDANYNTFKVWLDTKIRLNLCEFGHRWGTKPFDWTPRTAVQYLTQGETGWAEITATMCNKVPVEAELRSLREAVYKYHMCYDSQSVAYFESYTAMKNAMNQIRKHG